ncbi:sensor histidine kinase [Saccharicrinis sp. FJH62]|uniref:sensor histidine kinase n=1 Tax=Saccharicrinis sp. FJH62 TaxID=3344657 RepID=UPI0035D3EBD7
MDKFMYNRRRYIRTTAILIPGVSLILALVYFLFIDNGNNANLGSNIIHSIIMTSGIWLGCTVIISYLWAKIPWEHHPFKRLIIEIILITSYTVLFGIFVLWIGKQRGLISPEYKNLGSDIAITLLITFFITAIHESVFFYQQWKYNFSRSVRLEKDSIEARYETLKTQINPHFLFNSLNSLANMVSENEQATDYISNLSDFLRYILSSRDKELVLVREEIEILRKYADLQQSRFGENLHTDLQIDAAFYHYSIPPLVLQMLYENCIKHNIISSENPLEIRIFTNDNYIVVTNNLQYRSTVTSTGQGLRNITERYRYFTTKEVIIEQTKKQFSVKVPLLIVKS